MKNWWLAARPKTLTAALIPIVAASALAYRQGFPVENWILILCLVSAFCIQIATNLINDALDFDKGADTKERIGPLRMTASGGITRKSILSVAIILLFIAAICGWPLVVHGGWPIVGIGLVSIFMAYSYTGGPFPLAYLGLGDVFVVVFFGLIAVGGVYYLLSGHYSYSAFVLGLQIGFLSTVLIAINNLRDINQDRVANKKTLAVRFGIRFARMEIAGLLMATFVLQFYWWQQGFALAILPLYLLPLAFYIVFEIFRIEPSPIYNKLLGLSALLHFAYGSIFSIGLLYL